VFSPSAKVYGVLVALPIIEDLSLSIINAYGSSNLIVKGILTALYKSDNNWNNSCLRYANPLGAHESKQIGEVLDDIPNNLMPLIYQVAVGKREKLTVFGNDYHTKYGTGVRDYIHVVELARGYLVTPIYFQ
jgi:UDP-glucose 4-epimerase